ncbi:hypothetical protein Glove_168g125 [Diversispora epigaea]|uniref:Uncharacterized protein n=1 Tax=Diversispora epigaea TaxID=1348612 RepID=A0A397IPJ6_9GLOM|nr:hypothetical protein Glove_168g125 [Diversispora epigaea]
MHNAEMYPQPKCTCETIKHLWNDGISSANVVHKKHGSFKKITSESSRAISQNARNPSISSQTLVNKLFKKGIILNNFATFEKKLLIATPIFKWVHYSSFPGAGGVDGKLIECEIFLPRIVSKDCINISDEEAGFLLRNRQYTSFTSVMILPSVEENDLITREAIINIQNSDHKKLFIPVAWDHRLDLMLLIITGYETT